MKKKILYLLLALLLINCKKEKEANSFHNYMNFLSSIDNIFMEIIVKSKHFVQDSASVDTAKLYIVKDTSNKFFGANKFLIISKYRNYLFDGKEVYIVIKHNNTIIKEEPDSAIAELIPLFKAFWYKLDTSEAEKVYTYPDSIVLILPDDRDFNNRKLVIYLDKDGKPIKSKYSAKWMFMTQVVESIPIKYEVNNEKTITFLENYKIPSHYTLREPEANENIEEEFSYALLGEKAPNFSLTNLLENKQIELSELKGKNIILDFWYIGCYWCSKIAPHLNKLYNNYKNENILIIGVNPYDEKEKILKYWKYNKLDYIPAKVDRKTPKNYKVAGYPFILFIDKNGIIKDYVLGYDKDSCYQMLENRLKKLL